MANEYKNVLRTTSAEHDFKEMRANITRRIEAYEMARLRAKASVFVTISILSLFAIFPAISYFISGIAHSGFNLYLSLASSDWSFVTGHFKEFFSSIATAMPINETFILLTIVVLFFVSLLSTFRSMSTLFAGQKHLSIISS